MEKPIPLLPFIGSIKNLSWSNGDKLFLRANWRVTMNEMWHSCLLVQYVLFVSLFFQVSS